MPYVCPILHMGASRELSLGRGTLVQFLPLWRVGLYWIHQVLSFFARVSRPRVTRQNLKCKGCSNKLEQVEKWDEDL